MIVFASKFLFFLFWKKDSKYARRILLILSGSGKINIIIVRNLQDRFFKDVKGSNFEK